MCLLFTKTYEKWYRLDKKFGNLCRNLKYGWQRATKGYCESDTWGIYYWFLDTVPKMLLEFQENLHSHPGDRTPEEWEVIISDMAYHFTEATDDSSYKNKYDGTYPLGFGSKPLPNGMSQLVDLPMTEQEKINKELYFEEERKIDKYKNQCFEKGIDAFKRHFFDLWD